MKAEREQHAKEVEAAFREAINVGWAVGKRGYVLGENVTGIWLCSRAKAALDAEKGA